MHGHKTLTSIVRTPSEGPLRISKERGISNHQSAAHDAQIYAFFAHHYDFWTQKLGVNCEEWDCTLLDEGDVYVGDIWEFDNGEPEKGVVLQVCGGRVPCSRLAWRCKQKSSWLAEVAETGFCGVYLRVIQGGEIRAGSKTCVIRCEGENEVAVSSTAQCVFVPPSSPSTRELAENILRHPNPQNMNRQLLERKISMIDDEALAGKNAWKGWREMPQYLPGQFLPIRLPSGLARCWSISPRSDPASLSSTYRISVKKGLTASQWLHESCREGSILNARCPTGRFHLDWKPQYPPRQIYISAGIGITPLLPMLQAHFTHATFRRTPAIWIRVALSTTHNLLHATATGIDIQGRDYDFAGRPTESFIRNLLRDPYFVNPMRITPIELPAQVYTAYICGPAAFAGSMCAFLLAAKVPAPSIRSESFAIEPPDVAWGSDAAPREAVVRFRGSRKQARWERESGMSTLQLAESVGLSPEFGCRFGTCGSCEMRILEGSVAARGGRQGGGQLWGSGKGLFGCAS
ncbi:PK beta-barrel-protein domain-containing protein-like protein [Cenococcum geophilum 1.58]|uniref:PK beta-barrel-protein domain-containing protein-like protein n=1 Tax=Cenococcum geophilum 1.58 TaxID=794803 RepID=UPI0035901AB8|nr:PK beta-barrel-protein domain-containing protein-like protein [Cenococcum geophilum 1.58]